MYLIFLFLISSFHTKSFLSIFNNKIKGVYSNLKYTPSTKLILSPHFFKFSITMYYSGQFNLIFSSNPDGSPNLAFSKLSLKY